MSYPHRSTVGRIPSDLDPAVNVAARLGRATVPVDGRPLRAMPLTRRYEAAWLTPQGDVETSTRLAPATPLFEEAFSALARGSLIQTEFGPVAVEDLQPGTRVLTAEGRSETVTWVGSMMAYPRATSPHPDDQVTLTRITAESLGLGRPMPDLMLGPRARICLRDTRLRAQLGLEAAYVPARAFVDGVGVIELTPVAPVPMFHVVLARHGSLRVAGLEIESYHPGEGIAEMIAPRMLSLFAALFPQMPTLAGFGPLAHPRLTRFEVDGLLG